MKESLDMIFKERKFDSSENLVDLHDSKVRIHRRKVFFFFKPPLGYVDEGWP